ncbi:MAG: hypothetical protein MAG431_02402 [Chloroflexi bacterium]|nr:hypothetical protein [Chloroflexota bacterium]
MDVKEFVDEFLIALADIEHFENISLQTEGPFLLLGEGHFPVSLPQDVRCIAS